MKKLLYSLSLVLAGCMAATAAVPSVSVQKLNTPNLNGQKVEAMPSADMKAVPSAPKQVKNNASAQPQDFVGDYTWAGSNGLEGVVFPNEGSMTISISDTDPSKLIIAGFPYSDMPLEGYVKDGRLYIPNQFLAMNTHYNQEMWFMNMSVRNPGPGDEGGSYYYVDYPKTEFYFQWSNGILIAGTDPDQAKWEAHEYTDEELEDMVCFAGCFMPEDPSGYFWLCRWVEATPITMFNFVSNQWKPVGTAYFKDAWFPVYWEEYETPVYEVDLYRSYANENRFLLMNPYGVGTPYSQDFDGFMINMEPNKQGYIVFDITDPECVIFEPLVYSITLDQGETDPDPFPTYCYNAEGYYYAQGATTEDIIVNFLNEDMNVSFFDPNDADGPFVAIYNPVFSFDVPGYGYLNPLYWNDFDGEGWIILPEDYNAVKAIGEENDNAPEVYFNLQGVRVNNPEKGQIVIVRKGNKATKRVVR